MHKLTIEEMQRVDAATYRSLPKAPIVMVLDNVRSLHNVGSVFRTADAFRCAGIALCGITACPPSAEIHKTALGAEDVVAWRYYADTLEAVAALRSEGYTIVAIEQVSGSTDLTSWQPEQQRRYAFVLGNEVKGVQQAVVDTADFALEIPQYGTKHSLNVSVTAGIVLWQATKGHAALTTP